MKPAPFVYHRAHTQEEVIAPLVRRALRAAAERQRPRRGAPA